MQPIAASTQERGQEVPLYPLRTPDALNVPVLSAPLVQGMTPTGSTGLFNGERRGKMSPPGLQRLLPILPLALGSGSGGWKPGLGLYLETRLGLEASGPPEYPHGSSLGKQANGAHCCIRNGGSGPGGAFPR